MTAHSDRPDSEGRQAPGTSPAAPGGRAAAAVAREVCETGAEMLQVTRTGIWVWEEGREGLRRVHLFNRSTGHHGAGGLLERERFPAYLRALEEAGGALSVADAYRDERTRELREPYARPKGIRAWLDVPIPGDGEAAGVLRFEQVGPPREWTRREERLGRGLGELAAGAIGRDAAPSGGKEGREAGGAPDPGLTDLLPAGVVLADAEGRIVRCNEAYAEMLGHDPAEDLVGRPVSRMYAAEHVRRGLESRLRREGRVDLYGYDGHTRNGERRWLLENAVLLPPGEGPGEGERVLSVVIDATELKERESELEERAHRDPLTGLPNRRFLWESAEQTLALAERHGRKAAVAFVDLSGFKAVNDRYGHGVGDLVLEEAADRLVEGVRESDLVARMGGDEFAVLFTEIEGEEGVLEVGRRVLRALQRPVQVEGREIPLAADAGVALFPGHGGDADTLLERADEAMYRAKRHPEEHLLVYGEAEERAERAPGEERPPRGGGEPAESSAPPQPGRLADELEEALEAGRLALHYQPVYRLPERKLVGAEGLLRWDHPERGLLPASDFLPAARADADLLRALDQWAVNAALEQLRRWEGREAAPWISVNIDPDSLEALAFDLGARLEQAGVQPRKLVVEVVTESAPSAAAKRAATLRHLRQLGCRIALDLGADVDDLEACLRAYPADLVKLDTAYLERVAEGGGTGPAGTLAAGPAEGAEVLVKRVETEGQLRQARRSAAGLAQGFYWDRPAPADRIRAV